MAFSARDVGLSVALVLVTALVSEVAAQSLAQSKTTDRQFDVVQFGVPRDAKFVFCEGVQCPERSIKHLHVPPLPRPIPVAEQIVPVPQFAESREELSRAKVSPKTARKKKPVNAQCQPVTKAR